MKAITTKYHGPTNTRGARISARDCDGNRATISYPHELSGEAVHRAAADQLCGKMGWSGRLIGGAVKGGYVFVFADDAPAAEPDGSPLGTRYALGPDDDKGGN